MEPTRRNLKTRIMEIVEEHWDKTISQGAEQGVAQSQEVYDQLVAEGWSLRDNEMAKILDELHREGRIGPISPVLDSEGRRMHGATAIYEPRGRRRRR